MNNDVIVEHILDKKNRTVMLMTVLVATYVMAIAVAEVTGAIGVFPGVVLHAVLVPVLMGNYALLSDTLYGRVFPVLTLLPLLRILSLTMPINEVPEIYWHALAGAPLLLAVVLTARLLGLKSKKLGLGLPSWPAAILMSSIGPPLSLAGFLIMRPEPLVTHFRSWQFVLGVVILVVFAGFTEEVIFRGLFQNVMTELVGRGSIMFSSWFFAIMYTGSLSRAFVLFMAVVGLLFGWYVDQTRSIWGVVAAHSILSIGMILVWPILLPARVPSAISYVALLFSAIIALLIFYFVPRVLPPTEASV